MDAGPGSSRSGRGKADGAATSRKERAQAAGSATSRSKRAPAAVPATSLSNRAPAARGDLEADDTSTESDYERDVELYTNAIDTGPATPLLYTCRATALINLKKYSEAIIDADRAINLDPAGDKAHYSKGQALFQLKQYQSAKVALELASPNAGPECAELLKKCNKFIASQYRRVYYNRSSEVILSINAKNAIPPDCVRVEFGEEMVQVSIEVPGQEPYHFECDLFSKIIPVKSSFRVFPKEVEIRLMKSDEKLTWTSFSKSSMSTSDDFEFSWLESRLNGKDIVPQVQNQGCERTCTCVFYAIAYAGEMDLKRKAAGRKPPEISKVKFSPSGFIDDYETQEGQIPNDRSRSKRCLAALKLFRERGILAHGKDVPRVKHKISGYQTYTNLRFRQTEKLIKEGKPLIGSMRMDESFDQLGPNDIYDYDPSIAIMQKDRPETYVAHAVVFIGCGVRAGRAYLVFINSYGKAFGQRGFGRVYFGHVRKLHTIEF